MIFYRNLCLFLTLLCAFSCGEREFSVPYKVQLLGVEDKVGFASQIVTINTLTDPKTMEGSRCELRGGADISEDETGTSLLKFTEGSEIHPEFVVKDGLIKPSNMLSSIAFGSYYLFEQISQFWIDNYGLDIAAFGKIRIKLDPSMDQKTRMRSNAFYAGLGVQFFAVFPPAGTEPFPLALNRKILAHEFTHGVFDLVVFKRDNSLATKGLAEDRWNISGINEGLADFFSYTVTNSPDIFAEAFPEQAAYRALPVAWRSKQVATQALVKNTGLPGDFYVKGSVLTSALYEIGEKTGQDPVTMGKQVFAAFTPFSTLWQGNSWLGTFDYHYLINLILDQAPVAKRSTYCDVFKYWFNDQRNNQEITAKCVSF
jgi:hypothetical protein